MEARNRPDWMYQGAEAGRNKRLTADQISYAITLRRQLAEGLASAAARVAIFNHSPLGKELSAAGAICRREVRRMERAHVRLAAKAVAA